MGSDKVEAGDLRDRPKHRSSCSTVEEDFAATVVLALPSPLSMLSPIATPSARHPAQRAIAVAISSTGRAPVILDASQSAGFDVISTLGTPVMKLLHVSTSRRGRDGDVEK
jgi:hypothetical protein